MVAPRSYLELSDITLSHHVMFMLWSNAVRYPLEWKTFKAQSELH